MVLLLPIALLLMTAVSIAFVAGTSRLFNPYVAALVFLLFALSGEQPFSHEVFYAALLIHVWCLYLYMKGSLFWTSFFVSCAERLPANSTNAVSHITIFCFIIHSFLIDNIVNRMSEEVLLPQPTPRKASV